MQVLERQIKWVPNKVCHTYLFLGNYIFTENPQLSREYVTNKMLPEMKELAELVEPHVWWSDGDWEAKPEYW